MDDKGVLLDLGFFWSILLPRMAPRCSHVSGPRAAPALAVVSKRDHPEEGKVSPARPERHLWHREKVLDISGHATDKTGSREAWESRRGWPSLPLLPPRTAAACPRRPAALLPCLL